MVCIELYLVTAIIGNSKVAVVSDSKVLKGMRRRNLFSALLPNATVVISLHTIFVGVIFVFLLVENENMLLLLDVASELTNRKSILSSLMFVTA